MIDFTTQQLTWLLVGATTLGGGGYMTMNQKVENIDKNVAVSMANSENMDKKLADLQDQLLRIENKIDNQSLKKNK